MKRAHKERSRTSRDGEMAKCDIISDAAKIYRTCRDRKRKKFVGDSSAEKQKKIKTESGHYIKASYKSSAYRDWRDKHKIETPLTGLESEDTRDFASSAGGASAVSTGGRGPSRFRSRFRNSSSISGGKGKSSRVGDLKSKSEILKRRGIKQAQERRKKMKRKAAAVKGQSTKRRKGQTR